MADDWDLHAVVRGFTTTASAAATTSSSAALTTTCGLPFSTFHQDSNFTTSWFQDPFEPRRNTITEDLHDLYKPFFSQKSVISQQNLPINSPLSQQVVKQRPFSVVNCSKSTSSNNPSSRSSKKRKNHLKRVSHVPAESLNSDKWSWRKYGQKPIKGSPYPRGYYRCSTSKGCMARKQVERNRSDPGMFIVTYTGEHNHPMPTHRNSLAGSTRPKPPENPNSDEPKKPTSSPEMSPAVSLSPAPEKLESSPEDLVEAEDDDDNLSGSNMALDDDFFAGLENFAGRDSGDCLSDVFPADLEFPWLDSATATTTSGAGV
ncbi:hypothetical protein CDL12_13701 [Handroanthus impetiginosus]|uniref:WRKY domain-containing protein n=1 Tax=Handroanthus impetiginosus TaxID=429701 RepID=A0A2G9H8P8_9LAMI|nr:hypothetical protein CDL12_13701 [Handroanthus impetiginosus]